MKLAILLVAIFISGCASSREIASGSQQLKVRNAETVFVDGQGPTTEIVNAAIDAAIADDDAELASVLSLARFTDGEGSLNFGEILNSLRSVVGRDRFDRVLKSLPKDQQARVISDMESANKMHRFIREN